MFAPRSAIVHVQCRTSWCTKRLFYRLVRYAPGGVTGRMGPNRSMKADMRRRLQIVALVASALAVAGCERGFRSCGSSIGMAPDPTGGGAAPRGSSGSGPSAFDLGGTDCSDGLARCVAGHVEVSIAAHLPHPCSAGEKSRPNAGGPCVCPWRSASASRCARGCAKEGVEIVADEAVAVAQLCAADPSPPIVRPLLATELTTVTICSDEAVTCEGGVVISCQARGQPARRLAACVEGCASGVAVDPGEDLTSDGAISILCRRAHAERR